MKTKTFKWISSVSSGILGFVTAICIINGNFIIPLTAMALFTVLIATLKMKVKDKEVLTDERMDRVAGKAARLVYIITTYILAIATVIFAALSKTHDVFFGYSAITSATCIGMLLLYIAALSYYNHKKD